MSSIDDRIAQWEKMTREAPDDMAYFSLGSAYREAGRYEDAASAFASAIEHNEGMSRAYQYLGEAQMKLGDKDTAGPTLTKGYTVAAERGDVMPQRSIEAMLGKLDLPVPQVESAEAKRAAVEAESAGRMVLDKRAGVPQPKLDGPPMRGPVGVYILAPVSYTHLVAMARIPFPCGGHQRVCRVFGTGHGDIERAKLFVGVPGFGAVVEVLQFGDLLADATFTSAIDGGDRARVSVTFFEENCTEAPGGVEIRQDHGVEFQAFRAVHRHDAQAIGRGVFDGGRCDEPDKRAGAKHRCV